MRSISALLLLAFCYRLLSAQTLDYAIRVTNSTAGDKVKLEVELTFIPSSSDTTRFTLPTQINWSNGLQHSFCNFRAEGGRYVRADSVHVWVVGGRKAPVRLHYELIQPFSGEQVTLETSCSPILLRDYMQVPGECLFLVPWHYRRLFDVSVHWIDLPKGWSIQNSFGVETQEQRFLFTSTEWVRTMWVAGDFRILKGEVLGKPFAFALRGNWLFDDQTLFDIAQKTIETQRIEWDDKDIPFYSVTLIPFVLPTSGPPVGNARTGRCLGYGRYQSFVAFASDDCPLDPLIDLFNHEMMHDWIGGKIDTGSPDETASLRWFDEGFSDYYALRNRWRAGFSTTGAFLDALNRVFFARHYTDPFGETPNLMMERDYYVNPAYEDVPYRRGCILAFYLDCAIRQKTNNARTLHNFMLDLLDYCYGTHRNLLDRFDFFTETLAGYLGEADAEIFIRQYVDAGKRIDPSAFILPDFIALDTVNGVPQVRIKPGGEAEFKR